MCGGDQRSEGPSCVDPPRRLALTRAGSLRAGLMNVFTDVYLLLELADYKYTKVNVSGVGCYLGLEITLIYTGGNLGKHDISFGAILMAGSTSFSVLLL